MNLNQLPNFFIIGAAKAGTTTLTDLLRQHPQVYMSFDKEPMFFSRDEYYALGLDWYTSTFFRDADACPARGEATPHYLYWSEKTAPRLKEVYRERPVKFIAIFRDPTQRAYSWYWNMIKEGNEDQTFEQSMALEEERLRANADWLGSYGSMKYGYRRGGRYAALLQPFLERFPRQRFHFMLQEDLAEASFESAWRSLLSFLEVDPDFTPQLGAQNQASMPRSRALWRLIRQPGRLKELFKRVVPMELRYKLKMAAFQANSRSVQYPPMDTGTAAALRNYFREDLQRLEKIIDRDLSHWTGA